MVMAIGVHVLRYTLMTLAVLVIVGGGVYLVYYKSSRQRASSTTDSGSGTAPEQHPEPGNDLEP